MRLFAIARERAGMGETSLELPPGATVAQALNELAQRFPKLSAVLERSLVAVNREYAERHCSLSNGDELAVIPPVSGGALCKRS